MGTGLLVGPKSGNYCPLLNETSDAGVLLEARPFRAFRSSEEYLFAMKEDLAEWLNTLYSLNINVDNFMSKLDTGVTLCRHANNVLQQAREWQASGRSLAGLVVPPKDVTYRKEVSVGSFHARDNVSNFISWCRSLSILQCLLFETDDLVMRKNEKSFILCLLEVARKGSKLGMAAPLLVQMEQEIDREIEADQNKKPDNEDRGDLEDHEEEEVAAQKTTNDLHSLHERVVDLLSICSCPSQFPMIKVADGKYRIGDTKVLIFVRILRNHVMVRVGGGWDTLGHYLDRHDPCRCRSGHRFSTSAKLTLTAGDSNGPQMLVTYVRPESPGTVGGNHKNSATYAGASAPRLKRRNSSAPIGSVHPELLINGSPVRLRTSRSTSSAQPEFDPLREHSPASRASQCSDDSTNSSSLQMEGTSPLGAGTVIGKEPIQVAGHIYNDSSSSEFSECEAQQTNCKCPINGCASLSGNRVRKCSPRKIMKTSDLLGANKPSWAEEEVDFSSLGSLGDGEIKRDPSSVSSGSETGSVMSTTDDDQLLAPKLNGKSSGKLSASALSKQSKETSPSPSSKGSGPRPSRIPFMSKSRSDEDLSSTEKLSWKNPASYSPKRGGTISGATGSTYAQNNRRSSADNSQPAFSRGSVYGTLPRNRSSQSSLPSTPLTNGPPSSGFVRGSPGRYSLRSPNRQQQQQQQQPQDSPSARGSFRGPAIPASPSKTNGAELKTWTFKQRSRPALHPDLFKLPSASKSSSSPVRGNSVGNGNGNGTANDGGNNRIRSRSSGPALESTVHSSWSPKKQSNIGKKPEVPPKVQPQMSPLLRDILQTGDIYSDHKILERMEMLVNQYKTRIERAVPCRIVDDDDQGQEEGAAPCGTSRPVQESKYQTDEGHVNDVLRSGPDSGDAVIERVLNKAAAGSRIPIRQSLLRRSFKREA